MFVKKFYARNKFGVQVRRIASELPQVLMCTHSALTWHLHEPPFFSLSLQRHLPLPAIFHSSWQLQNLLVNWEVRRALRFSQYEPLCSLLQEKRVSWYHFQPKCIIKSKGNYGLCTSAFLSGSSFAYTVISTNFRRTHKCRPMQIFESQSQGQISTLAVFSLVLVLSQSHDRLF